MNINVHAYVHAFLSSVFDEIHRHSFFCVFGFVSLSNAGVPVFGAGAGKPGLMQSTGVLTQRFVNRINDFHVSPQITRSFFQSMDDSNNLTYDIHIWKNKFSSFPFRTEVLVPLT